MKFIFTFLLSVGSTFIYCQGLYHQNQIIDWNQTSNFNYVCQYDYDFKDAQNIAYVESSVKISITNGKGEILLYVPEFGKKLKYNIDYAYKENETGSYYFNITGSIDLYLRITVNSKGNIYSFEQISKKNNTSSVFYVQ